MIIIGICEYIHQKKKLYLCFKVINVYNEGCIFYVYISKIVV